MDFLFSSVQLHYAINQEKIIYDMEYIEKRSIWMDLACIGKTIRVVLCGAGAR